MLSNSEAKEIVRTQITDAGKKLMLTTTGDRDEKLTTLHQVEAHCNVALGMIDKYILLDDPRQVEKFFIRTERMRANLRHIRTDIEESRPDQQSHIQGLNANLDDLLTIV